MNRLSDNNNYDINEIISNVKNIVNNYELNSNYLDNLPKDIIIQILEKANEIGINELFGTFNNFFCKNYNNLIDLIKSNNKIPSKVYEKCMRLRGCSERKDNDATLFLIKTDQLHNLSSFNINFENVDKNNKLKIIKKIVEASNSMLDEYIEYSYFGNNKTTRESITDNEIDQMLFDNKQIVFNEILLFNKDKDILEKAKFVIENLNCDNTIKKIFLNRLDLKIKESNNNINKLIKIANKFAFKYKIK